VPSGNAWLLLHRNTVAGGTNHRMSNASDPQGSDHIDANHRQVETFKSLQPIAWAAGTADWIVQMVLRDKPNNAAPVAINVWSQSGTCTNASAVPASQRYASGPVSVPVAVDLRGIAVGVMATGVPQRTFAVTEVLCLSILATSGSGADDLHFYGDTFSTSGLSGRSALYGPFSFATAPYLLHAATLGGTRTMSTSASGAAGDNVTVNAGATVVFQSTSPILNASGLSPWPLLLVIRDPLALLSSAQSQVWKQTGTCTAYSAVPVASRFASGSFSIPASVSGDNGVSVSLAGSGAALTALGPSEVLCIAVTNTGLAGWALRLDTPSSAGAAGKSSLGGPFAQVAGLRAYGPRSNASDTPPTVALVAAWTALIAAISAYCRTARNR
jgi:hypothetical protein